MKKFKKRIPFICFWLVNGFLLFAANKLYPSNYVLGNAYYSYYGALVMASFVWTLIVWIAKPALGKLKMKWEGRFKMILFYSLVNAAGVWLTARIQPMTGFGITRYYWAIYLGLAGQLIQYGIWKICRFKSLLASK